MNGVHYRSLNYFVEDIELLMIEEEPRSPIESLPNEVIEHIFHHLPEPDKIVLSVASRKFRDFYNVSVQAGRIVIPEWHQLLYNKLNMLTRKKKEADQAIQRDRKCLTRCGGCWDFLPTLLYGEEKPDSENCCGEKRTDAYIKYCVTPCSTIAVFTAFLACYYCAAPGSLICNIPAASVCGCVSGSTCACCMINMTTIFGCATLQDKKFEILKNIETARVQQEDIRTILKELVPDHIKME